MRRLGVFLTALLMLAASGCAQPIDIEAERAALRNADVEWSNAASLKDVDGFMSFFTDDAILLPPNIDFLRGKEKLRELVSVMLASADFTWKPLEVEISGSGDLGYTIGTYEQVMIDSLGNSVMTRGKYLTAWKKQADGSWKVAADMWSSNQPVVISGN